MLVEREFHVLAWMELHGYRKTRVFFIPNSVGFIEKRLDDRPMASVSGELAII